jgi:hypothetical protein
VRLVSTGSAEGGRSQVQIVSLSSEQLPAVGEVFAGSHADYRRFATCSPTPPGERRCTAGVLHRYGARRDSVWGGRRCGGGRSAAWGGRVAAARRVPLSDVRKLRAAPPRFGVRAAGRQRRAGAAAGAASCRLRRARASAACRCLSGRRVADGPIRHLGQRRKQRGPRVRSPICWTPLSLRWAWCRWPVGFRNSAGCAEQRGLGSVDNQPMPCPSCIS